MPDPVWSYLYNLQQTPTQNGFTTRNNGAALTIATGNPASTRRVEIQSDNGDCVFVTTNVPALNEAVGLTAEADVQVSGTGDAGFEAHFLNRAFGIQVFAEQVQVIVAQDAAPGEQSHLLSTPSNTTRVLIRATYTPSGGGAGTLRIYRTPQAAIAWAQLTPAEGIAVPVAVKPFQEFLWWSEGGGTGVFRGLRSYFGGPVPPG